MGYSGVCIGVCVSPSHTGRTFNYFWWVRLAGLLHIIIRRWGMNMILRQGSRHG